MLLEHSPYLIKVRTIPRNPEEEGIETYIPRILFDLEVGIACSMLSPSILHPCVYYRPEQCVSVGDNFRSDLRTPPRPTAYKAARTCLSASTADFYSSPTVSFTSRDHASSHATTSSSLAFLRSPASTAPSSVTSFTGT